MKKIALGLVALAASPAFAADLGMKSGSTTYEAVPSWTGFYAGIIGTCGTGGQELNISRTVTKPGTPDDTKTEDKDESTPPTTETVNLASLDGVSFTGCGAGGQIGADLQIGTRWVIGIGADYEFSNSGGEASISGALAEELRLGSGGSATWDRGNSWLAYGRGGVLLSPNALLYVTAGYGRLIDGELTFSGGDTYSLADRNVVMIGAGFEHRFAGGQAAVKIEYRHKEFSDDVLGNIGDTTVSGPAREDVGLVGIVWRLSR